MKDRSRIVFLSRVDGVGACLSTLCAIHCLFLPILLLLPFAGLAFLKNELWEGIFIGGSMFLAVCSHLGGLRIHKKKRVLFTLLLASALIVTGKWAVPSHLELWFVVSGGALLALSHVLNKRFCHACPLCHPETAAGDRGRMNAQTLKEEA